MYRIRASLHGGSRVYPCKLSLGDYIIQFIRTYGKYTGIDRDPSCNNVNI